MESGRILSVKIVLHLHNSIFTAIFNKMTKRAFLLTHYSSFVVMRFAKKNKLAHNTVFCINLIDTIVNNYITVQEQWKILEITVTMC